jgi:hypothetical protein
MGIASECSIAIVKSDAVAKSAFCRDTAMSGNGMNDFVHSIKVFVRSFGRKWVDFWGLSTRERGR